MKKSVDWQTRRNVLANVKATELTKEGRDWSWMIRDEDGKPMAGGYARTKKAAQNDAQIWLDRLGPNIDENPEWYAERFAKTAAEFQSAIRRIAEAAKLPAEKVYALWREYSRTCDTYGQSEVFSEFQHWYADFLTPTTQEAA